MSEINRPIVTVVTSDTVPKDSQVYSTKVTIMSVHKGITLEQGKDCIWIDESQFLQIQTFLKNNNKI